MTLIIDIVQKMYRLGGKMAEGVDNAFAFFKGVEPVGSGALAGSPGNVTKWVNTRHTESSKKINDEIQGIEASLAKGQAQNANRLSGEKSGNLSLNIEKKTSVENAPVFEKKSAEFFDGLNLKSGAKDLELKESTKGNLDFKEWEDMPVSGQVKIASNGQRIISIRNLKRFTKEMNAKNIKVIIDTKGKILPSFADGGFDPKTGQIVLKKEPTYLSAMHEF
ncbi:hypothetical protein CN559_09520 [Bacillus pseudomycoides]|nr:hypothetical protein CN559_09520 [Bacillus pseudomycoides]